MRLLIAAHLLLGAATFAHPAKAEVSENLKFCAAFKSSKERLACYDAAILAPTQ
jgi:hypothetical protein